MLISHAEQLTQYVLCFFYPTKDATANKQSLKGL